MSVAGAELLEMCALSDWIAACWRLSLNTMTFRSEESQRARSERLTDRARDALLHPLQQLRSSYDLAHPARDTQRSMARRQDLDYTGRVQDATAQTPRSPLLAGTSGEGRARPELLSIHTSDAMLRSPDGHRRWDNGSGPGTHPHPHTETRMESTAASSATDAIVAQLHLIQSLQVQCHAEGSFRQHELTRPESCSAM